MKLLENPYWLYLPEAKPGDLIKLHVDDGQISGKVWVRVIAQLVSQDTRSCAAKIYAGKLDQYTVLDIKAKQAFIFSMRHVHYVYGQRWI